jgi:hypothetical protein
VPRVLGRRSGRNCSDASDANDNCVSADPSGAPPLNLTLPVGLNPPIDPVGNGLCTGDVETS